MQFSIRTLLLVTLAFGAIPFWYNYWLIPFFAIIIVCLAMSFHAFATEFRDDQS